jgi:hypothetical protein
VHYGGFNPPSFIRLFLSILQVHLEKHSFNFLTTSRMLAVAMGNMFLLIPLNSKFLRQQSYYFERNILNRKWKAWMADSYFS